MPSVMVGGSPAPEPIGASFDSVSGSFSETETITPRFTALSTSVNEPGTGLADGHGTSFTSSLVTSMPTLKGWVATTACVRATSTSRTGRLFSASHTPYAGDGGHENGYGEHYQRSCVPIHQSSLANSLRRICDVAVRTMLLPQFLLMRPRIGRSSRKLWL